MAEVSGVAGTTWPAKPEIFAIWLVTENVCQHLLQGSRMFELSWTLRLFNIGLDTEKKKQSHLKVLSSFYLLGPKELN